MREETEIAVYTASMNNAKYDNSVKLLFRNKEIIAPILKYVVPEYRDYSVEDIVRFIDADTITLEMPVNDIPIDNIPIDMKDQGTEFSSITEKLIRYDLHFKSKNPELSEDEKDILVMIYIDFEVQNDYSPAYPVIKRAVYYAARDISKQLGTITEKTNYSSIQKVYSIWVCNERIPKNMQNTVTRYTLQKQDVIGRAEEAVSDYDLMSIIIIRRGEEDSEEEIFKYLKAVFCADIEGIKEHVDIEDSEVEQEVRDMSGLGQAIMERGIECGIEQGIEQGIERGELLHLIKTVYKKMLKGKTNEEISDEAEENITVIEQIKEAILEYKKMSGEEEFHAGKVLEYLKEKN